MLGDYEAGNLLIAVTDAINSAGAEIEDRDAGAVSLAKAYAAQIDEALESGVGQDITKALYLGPHLLNALRELGLTPAARKAVDGDKVAEVGGKLAQLREERAKRAKRVS